MWERLLISITPLTLRRGAGRTLLCILAVVVLAPATLPDPATSMQFRARMARMLRATDTAKLRYIQSRSSGSELFEEGPATGTLPGRMRVYANLGPTLTATFTIYARHGTIVGHASATPHGSGRYESFGGSLVPSGGTGSYAHAHGRTGFYGIIDRLTFSMTVQTTGTLSY
jgi:hypothetical protein